MHYTEYLHITSSLARQDPRWKLSSRPLNRGYIQVGETEAPALLKEAVRLRIAEPINTKTIPDTLKKADKRNSRPIRKKARRQ